MTKHYGLNSKVEFMKYWSKFNSEKRIMSIGNKVYAVVDSLKAAIDNISMDINVLVDGEDNPICFFGATLVRTGVVEIWFIRDAEKTPKHTRDVILTARDYIEFWLKRSGNAFKVIAAVTPKWEKWARSIGLEFEYLEKKYDGHVDHKIYSRMV